ncbi:MAG: hypothetical protein QM765_37495 [Myxococcales bacterium]
MGISRATTSRNWRIVVQQGHGGDSFTFDVARADGRIFALSRGGGDQRGWELMPDGRWSLRRVWPGVTNSFRPWFGNVFVSSQFGSELLRLGEWGTPQLTSADGLPPRHSDIWGLDGSRFSAPWRGLAFQDAGDSDLDGVSNEWHLVFAADGKTWRPFSAEGLPQTVERFVSLDQDEICLRAPSATFRCWRYDGSRWALFALPETRPTRDIRVLDKPWAAVLEVEVAPGATEKVWIYRGQDRTWAPLAARFPGLPSRVADVRTYGARHLVGLQEQADADGDGVPWEWSWFVRQGEVFLPLTKALPFITAQDLDAEAFAGSSGVAVRPTPRRKEGPPGCSTQAPERCGHWSYFLRDGDAFKPLAEVLPTARGATVFATEDLANGQGFAVDALSSRLFFAQGADGRWRELHELIPGLPEKLAEVRSTDFQHEVGVRAEGSTEWHWLVCLDGKTWRPPAEVLKGAPIKPKSVTTLWADRLVQISDAFGTDHRWVQDQRGEWSRVVLESEPAASPSGAARLFTEAQELQAPGGLEPARPRCGASARRPPQPGPAARALRGMDAGDHGASRPAARAGGAQQRGPALRPGGAARIARRLAARDPRCARAVGARAARGARRSAARARRLRLSRRPRPRLAGRR